MAFRWRADVGPLKHADWVVNFADSGIMSQTHRRKGTGEDNSLSIDEMMKDRNISLMDKFRARVKHKKETGGGKSPLTVGCHQHIKTSYREKLINSKVKPM